MSEEELQKLIYKTIKDWVDEEAELNDHSNGTKESNFENICKQLSRWASEIKDDYKKYVDRPMEQGGGVMKTYEITVVCTTKREIVVKANSKKRG